MARRRADLVRAGQATRPARRPSFDVADPTLRADLEAILGGPIDDDDLLILTRRVWRQWSVMRSHANGLPVTVATLKRPRRAIDRPPRPARGSRPSSNPTGSGPCSTTFGDLEPAVSHVYREARRLARLDACPPRTSARPASATRSTGGASGPCSPSSVMNSPPLDPRARRGMTTSPARPSRLANAEAGSIGRERRLRLALRVRPIGAGAPGSKVARKPSPRWPTPSPSSPTLPPTSGRLADEAREIAYALRRFGQGWERRSRPGSTRSRPDWRPCIAASPPASTAEPDDLAARGLEIESASGSPRSREIDADLLALDTPLAWAWEHGLPSVEAASALSSGRAGRHPKAFGKAVQAQLKELGLASTTPASTVEVEIRITFGDDPSASQRPGTGASDRVEIVFTPNPGEAPKPLRKIASGGELSRVMLAVKTVLAEADRVSRPWFSTRSTPGLVAGWARPSAVSLAELSRHHQVICVTHLPADGQPRRPPVDYPQAEPTGGGRGPRSRPCSNRDERVDEIAAMLRGDSAAEGPGRKPSRCSWKPNRSLIHDEKRTLATDGTRKNTDSINS